MNYFQLAFTIGVFSFVYTYILTRPHMILNGLYNRLDAFFNTDKRSCTSKGPHWVFMVIMYCEKCNAGQLALWIFLYKYALPYYFEFGLIDAIGALMGFITLAIFTASVLKGLYIKYIE